MKDMNALVLANAVELSCCIIEEVAGNDVANTVHGESFSDVLATTVTAKINAKLAPQLGE